MSKYIFVYGTLMKSVPTNSWSSLLQENSIYLGEAIIRGELYDINRFPGLIKGEEQVYGELYEINNESIISVLDEYEDYNPANKAESLFIRELAIVTTIENEKKIEVWVYYFNKELGTSNRIVSGRYFEKHTKTSSGSLN